MLRINKSMLVEDTFNPALEYSDDDDLEMSIANNTVESVKRGLACAGIEIPSRNLKQLVSFAGKVKAEQRSIYQTSSDEHLQQQARSESHLKGKPITSKNVSYEPECK